MSKEEEDWQTIKFLHPLIESVEYTGNEAFRHMTVTIKCYGFDSDTGKVLSTDLLNLKTEGKD